MEFTAKAYAGMAECRVWLLVVPVSAVDIFEAFDVVFAEVGCHGVAEAAALVEYTVHDNCRCVVLAHLSEHNNRPDLARNAVSRVLRRSGKGHVDVRVAKTRGPTSPIVLEYSR